MNKVIFKNIICMLWYELVKSPWYLNSIFFLQNPNFSRLMRALCTMARREGKEGAHFFLSLMEENEVDLPNRVTLRISILKGSQWNEKISKLKLYSSWTFWILYSLVLSNHRFVQGLCSSCRWCLCQESGSGREGPLHSTPGFVLTLDPPHQGQ